MSNVFFVCNVQTKISQSEVKIEMAKRLRKDERGGILEAHLLLLLVLREKTGEAHLVVG